jgi:hypothetical protein
MKLEFSRQIFEKSSNIKFHENTSSESRVVPADGWTDGRTDRQTDIRKLIVAFLCFAKAPKTPVTYRVSTGLLTYLFTPWTRVLLEKLTSLQLVKKFTAFFIEPEGS